MMSHAATEPFDWTINERAAWPPRARPRAPFGPTMLEILRSCALRCCFELSDGYERQTGYAARIGIAFHRAMQSLADKPLTCATKSEAAVEGRRRFEHELALQEAERASRVRERSLPQDQARIFRATEAIMLEAQRLWDQQAWAIHPLVKPEPAHGSSSSLHPHAEIPVQSHDGLLTGRIDYVEYTPHGV